MTRKFTAALLLLLVSAGFSGAVSAKCDDDDCDSQKYVRKSFFNFSYLSDKLRLSDENFDFENLEGVWDEAGDVINDNVKGVRNNYGFSLTRGHTYAFHKKPIARLVTIGLDAIFFDVSYSNYSVVPASLGMSHQEDGKMTVVTEEMPLHKMEYSLQVGPSVTITPGKQLTVEAYARYAPTFSAVLVDRTFAGNYASIFVGGASVSYGKLGVGIEARVGSCEYKHLGGKGNVSFDGGRINASGFRAFVQIRW